MLVHGTGGAAATNWAHLMEAFADGRRRVIALDLSGSGDTTDDGDPLTLDRLAAQVHAVVDAAGGRPFDLLGFSLGACVAAHLAGRVKAVLGHKVHWTLPDYLQRSARHLASKTDLEQALAVGRAAVECALAGQNAVMPVIVRTSDAPYRWHVDIAPLDRIANHEKKMPANFIRKDGFGITAAARRYLSPLVAGEAPPPYAGDGLPAYVEPKLALVRKKLPTWAG